MQIDKLATGMNFTEGPREDDHGTLYFGEALGEGLFTWSESAGQRVVAPALANVGGCVIHQDGSVICSTDKGLARYNPGSGAVEAVDALVDGMPLGRVNDIEAAPDGSLWGGTLDHEALENGTEMNPGFLFRLDPTGHVTRYMDIIVPNGIEFSDDGSQLFFSESGDGVYVYDVAPDGRLSGRRAFALMPDSDGIVIDAEGGIWIARYQTNTVEYYSADGVLQHSVAVPFACATNACFGGLGMTTLFVTGGHLEETGSGGLVSFEVEIPGKALRKTSV